MPLDHQANPGVGRAEAGRDGATLAGYVPTFGESGQHPGTRFWSVGAVIATLQLGPPV